jgi:hypothetical protein
LAGTPVPTGEAEDAWIRLSSPTAAESITKSKAPEAGGTEAATHYPRSRRYPGCSAARSRCRAARVPVMVCVQAAAAWRAHHRTHRHRLGCNQRLQERGEDASG